MSNDVKITYVNKSYNPNNPTIFVFTKNQIPTFDPLKDGIAWKAFPDIGKGSSNSFVYPMKTYVQAMWGVGNKTQLLDAKIGKSYAVKKDETGIVLTEYLAASQSTNIEVINMVKVRDGVRAQIIKDRTRLIEENISAYDQKATFILHPKLYWGIASGIQEGQTISSAFLDCDFFWEQELEGVSETTVTLTGNLKEGYRFNMENIG
ncbi:MAG: hypothetical protein GY757_42700 [bacterium]|nr:hypothetical protein [bacterium]